MTQTDWTLVALGLCILVILAETVLLSRKSKKTKEEAEETERPQEIAASDVPPLLNKSELACFNTLNLVAGKEFHIMAKVSLADIAIIKRDANKSQLEKAAKSGQTYIDFVLCDRDKLGVVCAIEFGDVGKARGKHAVSAGEILENLGIKVFRLPKKTSYSDPEMREMLAAHLKERPPTPDEMVATISMEAFRTCKNCNSRMELKRAKSGKFKGVLFWTCSRYPECKTTELFTR